MKDSLKKAINLHQKHMDKPKTATAKSQESMMKMMKKHQNDEMKKRNK